MPHPKMNISSNLHYPKQDMFGNQKSDNQKDLFCMKNKKTHIISNVPKKKNVINVWKNMRVRK